MKQNTQILTTNHAPKAPDFLGGFCGLIVVYQSKLRAEGARKKIVLLKAIYGVQNLKYLVSDNGPQDISACPELSTCPIVRTLLGQWEKISESKIWYRQIYSFGRPHPKPDVKNERNTTASRPCDLAAFQTLAQTRTSR